MSPLALSTPPCSSTVMTETGTGPKDALTSCTNRSSSDRGRSVPVSARAKAITLDSASGTDSGLVGDDSVPEGDDMILANMRGRLKAGDLQLMLLLLSRGSP